MLTESFLVSTLAPDKSSHNSVSKDVGIHQYEFQPIPTLRSSYKKSSTNSHCLAVSPSHIFAAQAEKAVVHVYSRERGNQEAVVPFSERIRSIALCGHADGAGVLVLGTEGGRVMLWEVARSDLPQFFPEMLKTRSSYARVVKFQLRNLTCSPQRVLLLTKPLTSSSRGPRTRISICGPFHHYFRFCLPQATTATNHCHFHHFDPSPTIAPLSTPLDLATAPATATLPFLRPKTTPASSGTTSAVQLYIPSFSPPRPSV